MVTHPEGPQAPSVGEEDPNVLYIAAGKAIHSWEGLEQALARLYLLFTGTDDLPDHYYAFGKKFGTTARRVTAVENAGNIFFARTVEPVAAGELSDILSEVDGLRIERHRIAHGSIATWGAASIPTAPGAFEIQIKFQHRWAPPFYGAAKLQTTIYGHDGASIDAVTERFMRLHNRVHALTECLRELAP